jgi:hypothetical protein
VADNHRELSHAVKPNRAPHRTLRSLERNLRAQAPALILRSRSDQSLIERFGLPEGARLLSDHRCRYHMAGTGLLQGRLYLFSTHIVFAGRSSLQRRCAKSTEHTWTVELRNIVHIERDLGFGVLSSTQITTISQPAQPPKGTP